MSRLLGVYEEKPEDFSPAVEVAACHIESERGLLLLRRAPLESEPGTWGVPGGKIEAGESPIEGALRELFEETSIALERSSIEEVCKFYIRKAELDYTYHLFRIRLDRDFEVRISDEHTDYQWVSDTDLKDMPLIAGAKEILDFLVK